MIVAARIPLWVTDALIAVTVVASGLLPFEGMLRGNVEPPAIALRVLAAAALLLRRRWPILVLAASVAIFGAAAAIGVLNPTFEIPVAFAIYAVATKTSRRITIIAGIASALALPIMNALVTHSGPLDARTVQLSAVVAFAAAFGDATRSRRAYILAITERALRAEQTREAESQRAVAEERLRIARDLHDVVAHEIAVINLHAGVASGAIVDNPDLANRSLETVRRASRSVLQEIGDLLILLRTAEKDHNSPLIPLAGLARLDTLLQQFSESGLVISTHRSLHEHPSPAVDAVAYQSIQEALTNAHKHGLDDRVDLRIVTRGEWLEIRVENTTAVSAQLNRTGHGLVGLRERVESVRGTVKVTNSDGNFVLRVTLPFRENTDQVALPPTASAPQ